MRQLLRLSPNHRRIAILSLLSFIACARFIDHVEARRGHPLIAACSDRRHRRA